MFCMKCGAQVEEDDNFCMVCGFDLKHPETTQVEPEEVPTAKQATETAQIASEDAPQPTTQKLGEGYGDAVLRFKCPVCNSPFNGSETDRTCPICKTDKATIDLKGKGVLALYRIYNGWRDQPPLSLNLQIVPENEKVSFFTAKNYYGGVAINQRVNVVLPFGKYRFPNGKRTMYFEITPENPIFYATFRTPLFAEASVSDMPKENRIPMYDD